MILPAEFVMPRTGLVWREGLAVLKGLATYVGPLDWYRKLVKRGGRTQEHLYCFPVWLVDGRAFYERIAAIRSALLRDVENEFASGRLNYLAPYHELDLSKYGGSFDAVFSQAVLEHVENLGGTYRLMFSLLRPQG